MKLTPLIKTNDVRSINRAIQSLNKDLGPDAAPVFSSLTLTGLTASKLIYTDTDKLFASASVSLPLAFSSGTLTVTGLSTIGTANYLPGVNAAGNAWEYKNIVGTTNRVTVTHAANSITLSGPQDLHTGASPTFGALTIGDGGSGDKVIAFDGAADATITWDGTKFDFGTTPLLTTGAIGAGAITGTSFICSGSTLGATEFALLTGQDQTVKKASSPQFVGLKISGIGSQILTTQADGTVVGTTDNTPAWNSNSAHRVAEDAISGIVKCNGAGTYSAVTDNSSNWNAAYTDRMKWDGGAIGLVAATGRTSLGLGTADSPQFARIAIDDAGTYIDKDGSNNMVFVDAVTGSKTLAELATGGGTTDHAALSHLAYADSGHTGFEPTVTKGDLTAGSTKITIGGTGAGAVIGAGATVDVAEANVNHNALLNYDANRHAIVAETTSRTIDLDNTMSTAEIQAAINAVGRFILPNVTITFQFADGTYALTAALNFGGFFGGGIISIQGNTTEGATLHTTQAVILDGTGHNGDVVYVHDCSITTYIRWIKFIPNSAIPYNGGVKVYSFGHTVIQYCYALGNNVAGGYGFGIVYGIGVVHVCYVSNVLYGFVCTTGIMHVMNVDDTGTQPGYGLYAANGGRIGKRGTMPTGSIADELAEYGGEIA